MPKLLDDLISHVPAALVPTVLPDGCVSFFYHAVCDDPPPHLRHLFEIKSRADFERDVRYVREHWEPTAHERLAEQRLNGGRLPDGAVLLSFDDGLRSCFDVARPLLEEYSVPCTFFVAPGLLDNQTLMHRNLASLCVDRLLSLGAEEARDAGSRLAEPLGCVPDGVEKSLRVVTVLERERLTAAAELLGVDLPAYLREERPYMTREQVRALHDGGFTIGAHTLLHPEPWLIEFPEFEREVAESVEAVAEITGQRSMPFAIPFNGLRLRRSDLARMRARNPRISLIHDTNNLLSDPPFMVNRIWADTPRGARAASNLPLLLKQAQLFEPLRRVKRALQPRPR